MKKLLTCLLALVGISMMPVNAVEVIEGSFAPSEEELTIASHIEAITGEKAPAICPSSVHPGGIKFLPTTSYSFRGYMTRKGFIITELWPVATVEEMNNLIAARDSATPVAEPPVQIRPATVAEVKPPRARVIEDQGDDGEEAPAPIATTRDASGIQYPGAFRSPYEGVSSKSAITATASGHEVLPVEKKSSTEVSDILLKKVDLSTVPTVQPTQPIAEEEPIAPLEEVADALPTIAPPNTEPAAEAKPSITLVEEAPVKTEVSSKEFVPVILNTPFLSTTTRTYAVRDNAPPVTEDLWAALEAPKVSAPNLAMISLPEIKKGKGKFPLTMIMWVLVGSVAAAFFVASKTPLNHYKQVLADRFKRTEPMRDIASAKEAGTLPPVKTEVRATPVVPPTPEALPPTPVVVESAKVPEVQQPPAPVVAGSTQEGKVVTQWACTVIRPPLCSGISPEERAKKAAAAEKIPVTARPPENSDGKPSSEVAEPKVGKPPKREISKPQMALLTGQRVRQKTKSLFKIFK